MYLLTIEADEEIQATVRVLDDAWLLLCQHYERFPLFWPTCGTFRYWYGRCETTGVAGHIRAARLVDSDDNEVFRFRIYKLEG